nr:MAG: SAVED domain-containing protein [Leptolyngbya sp. IPPAS B-1204]
MRDQFELKQRWAVTRRDLQLAMLDENPHIVHFCGHGSGKQGLMFQNNTGQATLISTEALAGLFKLFTDLECVVLNACYSTEQAKVICQHIDYVIGMRQPISAQSAKEFAFGFYSALGSGRPYEDAYEFGQSSIHLAGSTEYDVPELHQRSLPINTSTPSLWIHGWKQERYDGSPTVELDWTGYYNRETRQIPTAATWRETLFPNLVQARNTLDQMKTLKYIDFRGKLPLTAMLAVGASFPAVGGYQFRIEQLTGGQRSYWYSNASPSELKFNVIEERGKVGKHLLIAFCISGSALADVVDFMDRSPDSFDAMVYAEPEIGTGDAVIRSEDATALAIHGKRLIKRYRQTHRATSTHLILYAPLGFCLFLGQQLNALGEIIAYERTPDGSYQSALQLQTG